MSSRHCIRAALCLLLVGGALPSAAQPGAAAPIREASFTVFLRAMAIGTEEIAVARDAGGWTITSAGRLSAPLELVTRRLELRYDADWKPLEMTLDATVRGQAQTIHTTISGTTATSEINIGGQSRVITATTNAELLFPSPLFAPFEALTPRLRTAAPGTTIAAFMPVQAELLIRVGESTSERIDTPGENIAATHTRISIVPQAPGSAEVDADVWADENGRLLRVSIPAQGLEVIRADLASVATRRVPVARPNDETVTISGNGFVLAGTLSKPAAPPAGKLPAVVLVGGSGPTDRDELVFGIPIFGQLAGAIADAGFLVLRYDKRGVGQSGGRDEAATLADYADDVRAAVKFLADRKDVDAKRIAVVGHSEGGSVAMIVAAKEKKIAALALVGTIGTTGAELNMEQVAHAFDRSGRSLDDKQKTLDLQEKIQQAVLTGTGWDEVAAYRRQADTPWFQSFLQFDPAAFMKDIRQPILILQPGLDTQVPPVHAGRLQALANERRRNPPAEVVVVPGVNHLLVPATTGEADEYPVLPDRHVSPRLSGALVTWLSKVFRK